MNFFVIFLLTVLILNHAEANPIQDEQKVNSIKVLETNVAHRRPYERRRDWEYGRYGGYRSRFDHFDNYDNYDNKNPYYYYTTRE